MKSMDEIIHFSIFPKVQPEIPVICMPYMLFLFRFCNENSLFYFIYFIFIYSFILDFNVWHYSLAVLTLVV